MDRRRAIQAGLIGGGILWSGTDATADLRTKSVPASPSTDLFDSHEIIESPIVDDTKGTEIWGSIGHGLHAREFNVPKGTHLILGQVQEASNYGHAKYQTLGIAINRTVWRCRVIWQMDWDIAGTLETHFHWVRF